MFLAKVFIPFFAVNFGIQHQIRREVRAICVRPTIAQVPIKTAMHADEIYISGKLNTLAM